MKEVTLEEIKKYAFEMLLFFKRVCEKNNIPYSLCFGTLLGAVRHKGFIPWDDDVDVCVLRKDYDKLIKAITEENHPYFKVICKAENKTYFYNFIKIVDIRTHLIEHSIKAIDNYGIYIDIFPLDNCPDSEKAFLRYAKRIRVLTAFKTASVSTGYNENKSRGYNIILFAMSLFAKCFGYNFWFSKVEKELKRFADIETKNVCCMTENPEFKEILPRNCLSERSVVTFENEEFSAFSNKEEYLKNRYNNYMEIPPIEKRGIQHNFSAYLKG